MQTPLSPTIEFIESGEHEKGFTQHFKAKILPLLQGVEEHRLLQYASYKRRFGLAFPICIAIFIGAGLLEVNVGSDEGDWIKMALGLCAMVFVWVRVPVFKYKQNVKSQFMPVICAFYGDLSYQVTGNSEVETKYKGEIFPHFSRQENEDLITGERNGIQLSMHETHLQNRNGKRTVTVFKGLVLDLEFKKSFTGKTILLKDGGTLGNFFTGEDFKGLKRVQLEDPRFEERFQVFSSDQVEARFVLTTAFMERLLALAELRSKNEGGTVQCVFENNRLVISIPSKNNLFEPGKISETALKVDDIHSFLAEMKSVFDLIAVLKLR